jgi:glycosyltransferase involved in cell wall biosynthesis
MQFLPCFFISSYNLSMELNRKLKILVVYANMGGCSYYRQLSPMKVLSEELSDKVEVRFTDNPLEFDEKSHSPPPQPENLVDMNWADVVFVANILKYGGNYTARVCGLAKQLGKFLHFDTDDLLTGLYEEHKLFGVYKEQKLDEITKFCYYHADLVTVTQKKFAQRIQPFASKILAVLKNTIDYSLPAWNAQKVPSKQTRIGWAGGIHHRTDVDVIAAIPHLVNQKVGRENIKWNFYGHPPPDQEKKGGWEDSVWPEYRQKILRAFKGQPNYQIYYALPPDQYGIYFSDMDIAIAPLEMNQFNDSKSDIKVAEAGRYKIPLVASNVGCYDETIKNGETGYLIDPDAPKTEWVRILSKMCKDKNHTREMGENLHRITEREFNARKVADYRYDLYLRAMTDLGYKLND